MQIRSIIATVAALLWCQPAHAAWHEASSDHFVIYADAAKSEISQFAEQLEKYHAGLALVTSSAVAKPTPSNRVTVYVVRDQREVRSLYGGKSKLVAGFYIPRAGGSMAIVPAVDSGHGTLSWSMLVLLHEYAHHFLMSSNSVAMPRWFNEGAAEFFASAQFERDGSMWIGRPANYRAGELLYARDVQATDLLDPAAYEKRKSNAHDAFYGKSWLLYHYLTFEPSRKGQFSKYIQSIGSGKAPRDAAVEAFGDLQILERDLDRYMVRSRMHALRLQPGQLRIGTVQVRPLDAGEAAIMPTRIRSKKGVQGGGEEAKRLLAQAREIAARYRDNPAVLAALAECEHDAGNDNEAVAAAQAAIKADPSRIDAHVQNSLALFRQAAQADDKKAAFRKARGALVALNKLENDHPLPLIYYHYSFVAEGREPPKLAVDGLIRAVQMAPFDMGLRMNLGQVLLKLGRGSDATIILEPVAFNPHGGKRAEYARTIIDRIGKDPKWQGNDLGAAPEEDEPEDEAA